MAVAAPALLPLRVEPCVTWPLGALCRGHVAATQGEDISGEGLAARFRWLFQHGARFEGEPVRELLKIGDEPEALEVIQEAPDPEDGPPHDKQWALSACRYNRHRCMQLLHEQGHFAPAKCSLEELLLGSVEGMPRDGHDACVTTATWLVATLTDADLPRRLRHPLTAGVFAAAARFGSVELLQQLAARGCPMGVTAWEGAARGGCVAALECLHDAGCPKPVRVSCMAMSAVVATMAAAVHALRHPARHSPRAAATACDLRVGLCAARRRHPGRAHARGAALHDVGGV